MLKDSHTENHVPEDISSKTIKGKRIVDEGIKGDLYAGKITRSDFGRNLLTKRVSLILGVLLLIGALITWGIFNINEESLKYGTRIFKFFTDQELLTFCLIGFIAQVIDGALGMAYGASTNTMLIQYGISPAIAIQSIKLSEVFTTAASGVSHWRMGNINKKLLKNLIIPGVIGALAGTLLLIGIEEFEELGVFLKKCIVIYVTLLGLYLIYKAIGIKNNNKKKTKKLNLLAFFGGFMDAIGGGGWGPIVSSTLISSGRSPKYTIGSVNLAEFFIAFVGAFTLTWAIGLDGWKVVVGLILGGVVASPLGALVAHKVKAKPLMILVGSLIIIVNCFTLYKMFFL